MALYRTYGMLLIKVLHSQTMSSAMDTTLRDETAYLEMVQDRKSKIQQLQKDIEEQGQKLERVQKQVSCVFCVCV